MPDNYSVAIETGGYRLLELFAERCGDDAAVTITDGDGHQIASHAMPVAERRHRFLIPVPTNVRLTVRARQLTVRFAYRLTAWPQCILSQPKPYGLNW